MAGRRAFTTTDVHSWELGNQRLRPSESLGPHERQAFLALIASCPLAQFVEADLPLLSRWCELEAMAQHAAAELRKGMVTSDGKISPWVSIHQMATKGQALLALRLRLGPSRLKPHLTAVAEKRARGSSAFSVPKRAAAMSSPPVNFFPKEVAQNRPPHLPRQQPPSPPSNQVVRMHPWEVLVWPSGLSRRPDWFRR